MDSLTESEIAQIVRLEREAGVQTLSRHFRWPELCDDRRRYHQEFVYDVAAFAADRGFSWRDVTRSAALARDVFPQLDDSDKRRSLVLLTDVLCERLPNLTPFHRHEFARYLADTCVAKRRLFQAVLGGSAEICRTQLCLEVELPPTPPPLEQGSDLRKWETETELPTRLAPILQQAEEELRLLRGGRRVTLGDLGVPEDGRLDQQRVVELVRAAVRGAESQMLASLSREAALITDILQLKRKLAAALATEGQQTTASSRRCRQKTGSYRK